MKVKVKQGIVGFSGQLDGAIYYYHPRLKRTLMRRKPKMPAQAQNAAYAAISRNLKALDPSDAYRHDFKVYAALLRDQDESCLAPSWYPLFTRMMWALRRKYPAQVELATLTREDILTLDLPCRSVRKAVEDGLMPEVPGWQHLNAGI